MPEKANEVCQKAWVYDKNGKGTLCDTREEAQVLINGGEYSDHPNGLFAKVKFEPAEVKVDKPKPIKKAHLKAVEDKE